MTFAVGAGASIHDGSHECAMRQATVKR